MSNARRKLNAAALRGVLMIAGLIPALGRSWTVFWLLVVVLTLTAIRARDMRLNRRRK